MSRDFAMVYVLSEVLARVGPALWLLEFVTSSLPTQMAIREALLAYFDRLKARCADLGVPLTTGYEEDCDSPAYRGTPNDDDVIEWTPTEKKDPVAFASLGGVLDVPASILDYWSCFWFFDLGGRVDGRDIQLFACHSTEAIAEFEALALHHREAHPLAAPAIPIGFESGSDLLIVVDCASNKVLVEDDERGTRVPIADTLEDLVDRMVPK